MDGSMDGLMVDDNIPEMASYVHQPLFLSSLSLRYHPLSIGA